MTIGPAIVLAVLVGIFHTALYLLIRGTGGGHVPLLAIAAVLGAGPVTRSAIGLGIDLLRIGDFHLISASVVAWIGTG